jgi:adenylate cyclase
MRSPYVDGKQSTANTSACCVDACLGSRSMASYRSGGQDNPHNGRAGSRSSTMPVTRTPDTTGVVPGPRRLIAVVYADMVGYSRLIGLDDLETLERLRNLRCEVIDPALDRYGGKVVQTGGDSLLMVFGSIDGAVRFAVSVQQDIPLLDGDQPPDRAIRFRIGIDIGDAIADGTDLHGEAVNVAVRLESQCTPGGICVSRAVRDHVRGQLDLAFEALGSLNLKNIARPVEAFILKFASDPGTSDPGTSDPGTSGPGTSGPGTSGPGSNVPALVGASAVAVVATPSRPGRRHRTRLATAGAVAVVSAGLVAWALHAGGVWDFGGTSRAAKPVEVATLAAPDHLARRPSVAVLPFRNLSADVDHDFFSDGITEDVISALGRFSNLLVISKSASFPFKDSNAAPAEIGRLLNARYLLDGSIRRAGHRVRVGTELTEAASGRLVWSETYDAEVDDIFAVQDNIARRVVGAAAVKLTRAEQERALAKPTSNLSAYEYVLRGREAFSQETRDDNDEASGFFQRAIDLDQLRRCLRCAGRFVLCGSDIRMVRIPGRRPRTGGSARPEGPGTGSGNDARLRGAGPYPALPEALRSCPHADRSRARNQSERCR